MDLLGGARGGNVAARARSVSAGDERARASSRRETLGTARSSAWRRALAKAAWRSRSCTSISRSCERRRLAVSGLIAGERRCVNDGSRPSAQDGCWLRPTRTVRGGGSRQLVKRDDDRGHGARTSDQANRRDRIAGPLTRSIDTIDSKKTCCCLIRCIRSFRPIRSFQSRDPPTDGDVYAGQREHSHPRTSPSRPR